MIIAQNGHNTLTHWAPPSCKGELFPCCANVVNLAFLILKYKLNILRDLTATERLRKIKKDH
jgi:hypothetical protein